MTVRSARRGFWDRILDRDPSMERTVWFDDDGQLQRTNLLEGSNSQMRRALRTNQDMVALATVIYAAVRRRSRAITRPGVILLENGEPVEDPAHPIRRLLRRINASLTFKQAVGLVETHKLTNGDAYWVKRRDGLGTVVDFEVWNPANVVVKATKEEPWVPVEFERHVGVKTTTVKAKDMIYFRHLLDPRNFLYGLGPIGAARVSLDTGLEAMRYNQGFFDRNASPDVLYMMEEGGPAEAARLEQELRSKFQGTDGSHRFGILSTALKELSKSMTHRDMQFLETVKWTVEEGARVFEMAPVLLGDYSNAAAIGGEAVSPAHRDFWAMIQDQLDSFLAELTEFLLEPDFGEQYSLVGDYSTIPALQEDRKLQAEIDEIELRSGKAYINEKKRRDGEEEVEWGHEPLVPKNLRPLSWEPPVKEPAASAGAPAASFPDPMDVDDYTAEGANDTDDERAAVSDMEDTMVDVFGQEMRRILRYITIQAQALGEQANAPEVIEIEGREKVPVRRGIRQVPPDIMNGFNWDMLMYSDVIIEDLTVMYESSLLGAGFAETGLTLPAQDLAANYARLRAGDLLKLSGQRNIVQWHKARVQRLVAEAVEKGQSVRTLKNNIRADFRDWTPARAETVARTELAFAQGDASLKTYHALGHEGKEWSWPGGKPDGVCDVNDGEVKHLDESFSSGDLTVPAHPRCRCALLPVVKMPEPK